MYWEKGIYFEVKQINLKILFIRAKFIILKPVT